MAPLMAGNGDWPSTWYVGIILIVLLAVGTYLVYRFFWKDVDTVTFDGLASTQRNTSAESSKVSLERMVEEEAPPEEAPAFHVAKSIDEEAPSIDASNSY